MERLRVKATECMYKKIGRRQLEQYINAINDKTMTAEIIKELVVLKDMGEVTSEQFISWMKNNEAE